MACGGVAPLGNGRRHSRRGRALPQTMGEALMQRYLFDTTLELLAMLWNRLLRNGLIASW